MQGVETHGVVQAPDGGPTLAYVLFSPPFASISGRSAPLRLAVVAHPLGRLGGRKEDHVVEAVAGCLVENGWTVCAYDARGAGDSGGTASFSGQPEADDYAEVLRQVLLPLIPSGPTRTPVDLLLAGYSFGSLAASACPPPALPGVEIRTRYLLVSYPLSVLWALTLFRSSRFQTALAERAKAGYDILAIHGDRDQFSAIEKLNTWSGELSEEAGAFKAVEVAAADHFWHGKTRRLVEEIRSWLVETSSSG